MTIYTNIRKSISCHSLSILTVLQLRYKCQESPLNAKIGKNRIYEKINNNVIIQIGHNKLSNVSIRLNIKTE